MQHSPNEEEGGVWLGLMVQQEVAVRLFEALQTSPPAQTAEPVLLCTLPAVCSLLS